MLRRVILLFCVFIMILLGSSIEKNRSEKYMAINFKGGSDGHIKFPIGTLPDLDTKSIGGWIYVNSFLEGDGNEYMIQSVSSDLSLCGFHFRIGENSHKLYYFQDFDTGHGNCYVLVVSTNAVISAPGLYHVMIVWDRNYLHTAVLYVDGISVPVTQIDTHDMPACDLTGFELDDSTVPLVLGSPWTASATADAVDGWMADWRIYNRQLSEDEVYEIFKMRGADTVKKGLIFRAKMNGAAGIQNFNGAVLGASNVILNEIGNEIGVPYNNPEGVEDTVLCGK